jgi:hypothetical protein
MSITSSKASQAAEVGFLLTIPLLAVLVLHLALLRQDGFVDPWFYTGYANAPAEMFGAFGWTYYFSRPPVILSSHISTQAFGAIQGYFVTRYLLFLLVAIPLYFIIKRTFDPAVAVIAVLFLVACPLFPRVIMWELPPSYGVSFAIAGACLWWMPTRARRLTRFSAGALFCASILSHLFMLTAVALLGVIDVGYRVLDKRERSLTRSDYVAAIGGATGTVIISLAGYFLIIGHFNPANIFTVTLQAAKVAQEYTISHATRDFSWLGSAQYVAVPLTLCVGLAVGLGRELLSSSVPARAAHFALAYTSFYVVEQFVLSSFILETFYYFAQLNIAVVLALPTWLGIVKRSSTAYGFSFTIVSAVALLSFPLLQNFGTADFETLVLRNLSGSVTVTIVLCFTGTVAALLSVLPTPALIRALAVAGLCGTIQIASFVSHSHQRMFGYPALDRRELDVYRAALSVVDAFKEARGDGKSFLIWANTSEHSVTSIGSALILPTLNDPWQREGGLPSLSERELKALGQSDRRVLILSEVSDRIHEGVEALGRQGIRYRVLWRRRLGGESYAVDALLIEIV